MSLHRSSIARFAVVVALVVGGTVFVRAHTKLEKSEPAAGAMLNAAPKQLQLWFNETLDPAVSRLEMTNGSTPVELSGIHVMGGKTLMATVTGRVSSGTYKVAWQTAGDDGHLVKGDFTFTVKSTTH